MTLSKQEMLNKSYFFESEQTLDDGIEEKVMQMFASCNQVSSLEKQIDEITDQISQDFLSAIDSNTNIDLDSLLEKFSDSKCLRVLRSVNTYSTIYIIIGI